VLLPPQLKNFRNLNQLVEALRPSVDAARVGKLDGGRYECVHVLVVVCGCMYVHEHACMCVCVCVCMCMSLCICVSVWEEKYECQISVQWGRVGCGERCGGAGLLVSIRRSTMEFE